MVMGNQETPKAHCRSDGPNVTEGVFLFLAKNELLIRTAPGGKDRQGAARRDAGGPFLSSEFNLQVLYFLSAPILLVYCVNFCCFFRSMPHRHLSVFDR